MRRLVVAGLLGLALAASAQEARAAAGPAVPLLAFHQVEAAALERQVAALEREGYAAVTLDRVRRRWSGGRGRLPRRPVVLSFDDGYASHHAAALPVLERRRWPGVLFLSLAWLDRPGGLAEAEVRELLDAGWELGGHTRTHPDLTEVEPDALADEVAGGRTALRERFGVPVRSFAYPYGRWDEAVEAAVRDAGFSAGATIRRGLASPADGTLTVDRISVGRRTSARALLARMRDAARRDAARPTG